MCVGGARSSPAGSQGTARAPPHRPARPPGGLRATTAGAPTPPRKAPCARMAARKIKTLPGNGAARGFGSGSRPSLGPRAASARPGSRLPPPAPRPPPRPAGSEPPLAAARGMSGPRCLLPPAPGRLLLFSAPNRALHVGETPPARPGGRFPQQPPPALGERLSHSRSWGCLRWFPPHREATAGPGSPRTSGCSRLKGCSGEELRACRVLLPSPKLLQMGRGGGDVKLWVRDVRRAA